MDSCRTSPQPWMGAVEDGTRGVDDDGRGARPLLGAQSLAGFAPTHAGVEGKNDGRSVRRVAATAGA